MSRAARLPWSPREDNILRLEWGELSPRVLREKLPGRTWAAIKLRAARLRLGSPARGRISVAEAARKAGFARQTMLQILANYGVRIERHPGGIRAQRRVCPRYLVDPDEALEAVERHLAVERSVECLAHAAVRVGVAAGTLRSLLLRAKAIEVGERGKRKRIDPSVVDHAVRVG